jgi:hypothetical protein
MASLLNTTGGYVLDLGLAGAEATGSISEKDTFINEATTNGIDSAGTIDYGVIVAKGTEDKGVVPLTASNGSQRVQGLTTRVALQSASLPGNVVGYKTGAAVPVARLGDYVVYAAEAVREGDEVIALATTVTISTGITTNVGGAKGGVANGTTRLACVGMKWKTTTAAQAKGIVSVYSRDLGTVLTS